MSNNTLRPNQIQNLIDEAVKAGFVVAGDETCALTNSRLISLTGSEPHYLSGSHQILITHRLPEKKDRIFTQRRQSVSVTTYRHYAYGPSKKSEGVWDAWYAIRDLKATWARHNEREAAKASATVTETVNA